MSGGEVAAAGRRPQASERQRPENKLVEFHGVDEAPRQRAEDTPLSAASHSKPRTGPVAS
jgi:hypothetical protein